MPPLPPLPPLPAVMGLSCYKCFKEEDVSLSRCSGCLRIAYCSRECQQLDWKTHKPMCQALSGIGKNTPIATGTLLSLPSEPTTDMNLVNKIAQVERSLQRDMSLFEKELVIYEPRCIVCARTDNLIRIEAAANGTTTERLNPCPDCNLSFCCSPAHWDVARPIHDAPCEDARDRLSQCKLNRGKREYIKFVALMADQHDASGQLIWAPERVKSAWLSLTGLSWESELGDELRESLGIPPSHPITPWVRSASDSLSRAMTILYALEKLNDDDEWTRMHTLTIHVTNIKEVTLSITFEEILHRLPNINTLKVRRIMIHETIILTRCTTARAVWSRPARTPPGTFKPKVETELEPELEESTAEPEVESLPSERVDSAVLTNGGD
ncbi:hypothetical protein B0H14DRAFT_2337301 [Mycena olivaceomarginata]|nr:hypothetical protein B0H14DRAFT_2337301 [Mycena olivaceomarginata]